MKIVVEAQSILKNRSGVGWFAHGLIRGLQQELQPDDSVQLLTHPREAMDIDDLLTNPQTVDRPIDWLPSRLYHSLKFHNAMPPVDLFYGKGVYIFPNFIRWPLAYSPSVIVVHDLSMFVCPDYLHPKNLAFMTKHLPRSIQRADLIVAVSRATKQILCDHLSVDPAKVVVSHLAAEPSLYYPRQEAEIASIKGKYGIFGKYFFFLSTLEPRKNIEGLVAAYRSLPQSIKNEYSLVLVGGRGWQDDSIREAIQEARAAGDRIILPGYVTTEDIPALYSGAVAFVFPSHYEGFGLPALEALNCGTPVITANNSSLPEVCGTAALYVDANSVEQIAQSMRRIVEDPEIRSTLITKGYRQAKKFSWAQCAESVLKGINQRNLT